MAETPSWSVDNYSKDWEKRFCESSVKIHCDLNRICEVEEAVEEWYEERYHQRKVDLLDLGFLKDKFDVK